MSEGLVKIGQCRRTGRELAIIWHAEIIPHSRLPSKAAWKFTWRLSHNQEWSYPVGMNGVATTENLELLIRHAGFTAHKQHCAISRRCRCGQGHYSAIDLRCGKCRNKHDVREHRRISEVIA